MNSLPAVVPIPVFPAQEGPPLGRDGQGSTVGQKGALPQQETKATVIQQPSF